MRPLLLLLPCPIALAALLGGCGPKAIKLDPADSTPPDDASSGLLEPWTPPSVAEPSGCTLDVAPLAVEVTAVPVEVPVMVLGCDGPVECQGIVYGPLGELRASWTSCPEVEGLTALTLLVEADSPVADAHLLPQVGEVVLDVHILLTQD